MITETELGLDDGRTLHVYDTGPSDPGPGSLPVFWHHGSPNTGTPPEPLFPAGAGRGIRWVSFDRPGYAGSSPRPGRDVASVAGDVASVADALGIGRFAVMGHSGGGPHALACAALLPDRVLATVAMSSPAPYAAAGLDWSAGMATAQEEEIRATVAVREPLEQHLASHEFDPEVFTAADQAALLGDWAWLAAHCPDAELWLRPGDGHVSVLGTPAVATLDWLVGQRG